VTVISY